LKKLGIYTKIKDFLFPSPEYNYIKSYNLPEIRANSANSEKFRKKILKLNPDIIIVGTWSEKIEKSTIQLPKIATINVHPSLLPKYRGPNPYLQTIWHDEKFSGLTFHLMTEKLDAGAILLQKKVEIKPDDTGKELKERTVLMARGAVCELLNNLAEDFIIPVEQNESNATYFPQITTNDVMIDFSKSAKEVYNHIRAFSPWTKTYFSHKNKFFIPNPYNVEILEKMAENAVSGMIVEKSEKNKSLTIVCGDKKLIRFSNLGLYGRLNKFFVKLYIKYIVKINDFVE